MARRGRPPLPKAQVKSEKLIMRVTLDERNAMDQAAHDDGYVSASEWAREILTRAVTGAKRRSLARSTKTSSSTTAQRARDRLRRLAVARSRTPS